MLQKNAEDVFFRSPSIPKDVMEYEIPVDTTELMKDVTLKKLEDIFSSVLRRKEDRRDPIRARFGDIPKEEIPLEKKMAYVKDYISKHRSCSFKALLTEQSDKTEVIVAFLSILELMKTGEIVVKQERIFDDIIISSKQ
jgi:segregation and condensation protein A